jgi:hypothetical protein
MYKQLFFISIFFLVCQSEINAQAGLAAIKLARDEKDKFLLGLKSTSADSSIVYPLARYFESEANGIYVSLSSDKSLSTLEREKAIRSTIFFIQELNRNLEQRKLDIYDLPGAIRSYDKILTAILHHRSVYPIIMSLSTRRCEILAAAFSQYPESALMNDIAIYKRVSSEPQYILRFLETKPTFRFTDSLLRVAVIYDPMRIIYYLKNGNATVRSLIIHSRDNYIQQVISLANNKNVSELLPFTSAISSQSLSADEIVEKRTDPLNYFQLMVNTMGDYTARGSTSSTFIQPLRKGLREKALSFYVNEINELHTSGEATRFASVKNLRTQDLYYVITSCGEELYTSSYLGLYKRLMDKLGSSPDSLFDLMHYDNFHIFIRLAANYNVLSDFLHRLNPDLMMEVLKMFIADIDLNEITALDRAMDIADSFTALSTDPSICDMLEEQINTNLERCRSGQHFLGIRLYGILSDILKTVRQKDGARTLWETLGDYEILKRNAIENAGGEVIEVVLFYGDEDGITSFSSFMRNYTDKSKWEINKNPRYVTIHSKTDHPLTIYANLPLDIKDELDVQAQDSLFERLDEQNLEPTIIVHRGHSYHLDKTLMRIRPSIKLAILGSCGGYNKAISIANINPDVQVIGSKKTGSMSINDPILDEINKTIIEGKDLEWPELWKKLTDRFSRDEGSLALFNEYFPPSTNLGLFVLKLYNYYNRFGLSRNSKPIMTEIGKGNISSTKN